MNPQLHERIDEQDAQERAIQPILALGLDMTSDTASRDVFRESQSGDQLPASLKPNGDVLSIPDLTGGGTFGRPFGYPLILTKDEPRSGRRA